MESRGKRMQFTPLRLRKQDRFDQMELCKSSILQERDTDDLVVKDIDEMIGKGLFATKKFYQGDFLVEYHGEFITDETACKRETDYEEKLGSYLYFFKYRGKPLCIDATFSKRKGRFINDGVGSAKNSVVKVVEIANRPHLAVFAAKNIQPGEEVRFDYGVSNLPWRKKKDSLERKMPPQFSSVDKMKEDIKTQNKIDQYDWSKKCFVKLPRLSTQDLLALAPEKLLKLYQPKKSNFPLAEECAHPNVFAHPTTVESSVCLTTPSKSTAYTTTTNTTTTQSSNNTGKHQEKRSSDVQMSFSKSDTLTNKVNPIQIQQEIIRQQEVELQQADILLKRPDTTTSNKIIKDPFCFSTEIASPTNPWKTDAEDYYQHPKLKQNQLPISIEKESYSSLLNSTQHNNLINDDSTSYDEEPIGPIWTLVPRKFHHYIDDETLRSYLTSNQKDADKFLEKVLVADIPVIAHPKDDAVYPLLLKNITEKGRMAIEEINNPWVVNTLVDFVPTFEAYLSRNLASASGPDMHSKLYQRKKSNFVRTEEGKHAVASSEDFDVFSHQTTVGGSLCQTSPSKSSSPSTLTTYTTTSQSGNISCHLIEEGSSEVLKSFYKSNTTANKVKQIHMQQEIIRQQEAELQQANIWLGRLDKTRSNKITNAQVCLSTEEALPENRQKTVAEDYYRHQQLKQNQLLMSKENEHCFPSESFSTPRKPSQLNTSIKSGSSAYDEEPIGPICTLVPRKFHRYIDYDTLRSYLTSNQKDADRFLENVLVADIPVIAHPKDNAVYPLLLKNITEKGRMAIEEINNPWVVNTLVDFVPTFDAYLSRNPASGEQIIDSPDSKSQQHSKEYTPSKDMVPQLSKEQADVDTTRSSVILTVPSPSRGKEIIDFPDSKSQQHSKEYTTRSESKGMAPKLSQEQVDVDTTRSSAILNVPSPSRGKQITDSADAKSQQHSKEFTTRSESKDMVPLLSQEQADVDTTRSSAIFTVPSPSCGKQMIDSPDSKSQQHSKEYTTRSESKDMVPQLSQEQTDADTTRSSAILNVPSPSRGKQMIDSPDSEFQQHSKEYTPSKDMVPQLSQDHADVDKTNTAILTVPSPSRGQFLAGSTTHANCIASKPKIKPHRPCPFCQNFMSKLSKHIEKKHKDEEVVKQALSLPRHERVKAFDAFRKKGILKFNLKTMKDKNHSNTDIIPERKGKGTRKLSYCSNCFAFISTRLFHRHRRLCFMTDGSPNTVPVPIKPTIGKEQISEFDKDIMSSFHTDETGEICRQDSLIKGYGRHHFKKVTRETDKKDEKRKSLMSEMRRLGRLYLSFKENCNTVGGKCTSAIDMFERSNFGILEKSICDLTANSDGTFKDGVKVGFGYLLKKTASYILGDYYAKKEDVKAKEIKKFQLLLNYHWIRLFSDSEYSVKKVCQSISRKPQNLPLADDIERLREYTVENIKEITKDTYRFIGRNDFVLLRDLLVCRLTLFNARRGGEPSRLKLSEWQEADKNIWHEQNWIETIEDPLDKILFGRYKLAYQPGKTGKLVPLLILDDCWQGIKIMTDPEIRDQVGVCKDNVYVFPNTELSKKHVIGWDAVNKCCTLASCSKTVTATNRRHQVATVYASHDVPTSERSGFLMHMDHSENINLNVYQCPPSTLEVTKVGKFLLELDQKGGCKRPYPTSITEQSTPKEKEILSGKMNHSMTDEYQRSFSTPSPHPSTSQENESSLGGNQRPFSSLNAERSTPHRKKTLLSEVAPPFTGKRNTKRKISWTSTEFETHEQPKQQLKDTVVDVKAQTTYSSPSHELIKSVEELDNRKLNSTPSRREIKIESTPLKKESKVATPKKRQYYKWSKEETKFVVDYFKEFIFSLDNLDSNKGKLPGKLEVSNFLQEYPWVLDQEDYKERIKRVKLKVFNERKTTRMNLKNKD